jgi:hypothetical protein
MNKFLISMAFAAALVVPGVASAGSDVEDRSDAVRLCRAEVQSQTGLTAAQVRLDQVRLRRSNVRVDLDVFRDGQLQNVRCDVSRARGQNLTIASITPALQTASLAR